MVRMGSSRICSALGVCLSFLITTAASAQTSNSSPTSVTLTAVMGSSISVTTDVTAYNWAALTAGGTTAAASAVTITTTWVLASTVNHVELDCYFATPAHAMSDGGSNYIPASAILGTVSGADTSGPSPLTASNTLGGASSGLTIFNHTLNADYSGSRVDALQLSIDLSGISLPAGTYTGTLTFRAQAL